MSCKYNLSLVPTPDIHLNHQKRNESLCLGPYLGVCRLPILRVGTSVALGRNPESLTSLLFTTIYLIVVHWTIIFGHIRIEIPETTLLLMIMILSLPQIIMYWWKISTSQEFKFPRSKLLIRICFIHGYLFALLYVREDPIVGSAAVLVGAGIFVLLRAVAIRESQQELHFRS